MTVYSKQELLDNFGTVGQRALQEAHVLLVGAGGLGCACAEQLVMMGLGRLSLVDGDIVARSNLSRQVLYREKDVGRKKVEAAADFLRALRAECRVDVVAEYLTPALCEALVPEVDLVIDATDNFDAKFLANAVAAKFAKPLVWANAQKWEGQLASFRASEGPCYQCLLPSQPRRASSLGACNEIGVLGVVPNILGAHQALEAVKVICELKGVPNSPRPRWGELVSFSFRDNSVFKNPIAKSPHCPLCSKPACEIVLPECQAPACSVEPDLRDAAALLSLQELGKGQAHQWLLVDVREPDEQAQLPVPGSLSLPLSSLRVDCVAASAEFSRRVACGVGQARGIALFCRSGKRSRESYSLLKSVWSHAGEIRVLRENAEELRKLLA